ncbi:MAG TPA: N-acetyltransferase [Nitrospirota bacterium]|jgi:GNAT superfamily N-acetyltransferase
MDGPRISIVEDRKAAERFIGLPYRLYRDDPFWVPPLKSDVRELLDRAKNPFFEHAEAEFFLAERGGRAVGRVAAIIDRNYNTYHESRAGWFGFFECEDDQEAATGLLSAACGWLTARGMEEVFGPASPTLNDEAGFLLEGHGMSPRLMMAYNPPYYHRLAEGAGFVKAKDLFAWWLDASLPPPERVARIADKVASRNGITVRSIKMGDFRAELGLVKEIYNSAWEKNWDFASMTEAEVDFMARKLKPVIVPDMVRFVEVGGRAVAVSIAVPDINLVLKGMGGSLLPFGWLKFLLGRGKVKEYRLFAMGTRPEYRGKGFDAVLYVDALRQGQKLGVTGAELSWTLEDNEAINSGIRAMGAELYKRYRVYEKRLG